MSGPQYGKYGYIKQDFQSCELFFAKPFNNFKLAATLKRAADFKVQEFMAIQCANLKLQRITSLVIYEHLQKLFGKFKTNNIFDHER
ncbi:CIC11C00000002460 [Sungouiella intermedia]|uniref:CIC11C00000002460 n=1 Tax=Sungouiella intermedia TaxID=45354 RepID=A0A1L0D256_9ASCO|nr:CIC11C00000002460 [[Candida] intermedia]